MEQVNVDSQAPHVVHLHVEYREGVQGGRAVIRGTRFPVSSIVRNHRRGLNVEEMLREFPHLTASQIYDALSFYHDHRLQIDREIDQLQDLDAVIAKYPPTRYPRNGNS